MGFPFSTAKSRVLFAKAVAVASSLMLLGCYVNYRATGSWLPASKHAEISATPSGSEEKLLPISKTGGLLTTSHAEPSKILLPGSKEAVVFPLPPPPVHPHTLISGSKSG